MSEPVRGWLESGQLNLPLPGRGATAERWWRLAELTQRDIVAGRLAEAHADAVAILEELSGKPPAPGELWGVWAAEGPHATLGADAADAVLRGSKPWCSGAGLCDRALVTARRPDGSRGLFSVDLTGPGVRPLPATWRNTGMAGTDTRTVQFSDAPAVLVGRPGDYLTRPGFWHGAVGVAACWLGGARAVAEPLYGRGADGALDEHGFAHLGAVDAALAAAAAILADTAALFDADPLDRADQARLLALRARAVVERAVDEAITRTGRGLGPAPLAQDGRHARNVADLTVYIRQSHAERDLADLGRQVGRCS